MNLVIIMIPPIPNVPVRHMVRDIDIIINIEAKKRKNKVRRPKGKKIIYLGSL
jgi:hypothetical protein